MYFAAMSRRRLMAGLAGAAVITALLSPQLFYDFASVRIKAIRTEVVSADSVLALAIGPESQFDQLPATSALIVRLKNATAAPISIRVAVDGIDVCAASVAAAAMRRIDCTMRGRLQPDIPHQLVFTGTAPGFAVDSVEIATHFGAISPGPRDLIIAPVGSHAHQSPGAPALAGVALLIALSLWSVRMPGVPKWLVVVHLAVTGIVAVVIAAAIFAKYATSYSILLSIGFLTRLLALSALPAALTFVTRAIRPARPHMAAAFRWLMRKRAALQLVAVGVVVFGAFLLYTNVRIGSYHGGNATGLLQISHYYYDRHPVLAEREDIRATLWFAPGYGSDGQWFYFMAFDPVLAKYGHRPRSYTTFIDHPPYRFGRIGFSWLTRLLSGGRELRYPATMVAIVITALAASAMLLGAIARRNGVSSWYGALILLVPGFWWSVAFTLPEPLAIACILAGWLLVLRGNPWAAGLALGYAMLVRETSGALVLAAPITLWLSGKRKDAAIVAGFAFVPVVAWKLYVASIFYDAMGTRALFPHPDDVAAPFAGMIQLWNTIPHAVAQEGWTPVARATSIFPLVALAAVALAVWHLFRRANSMAAVAVFYGLLTVTFNYKEVWSINPNAERLTIDLFIAVLLAPLLPAASVRTSRSALRWFWIGMAIYLLFGTQEAMYMRRMLFAWL